MTSIVQTTDIVSVGIAVADTGGVPQLLSGQLFYLTAGTNIISTGSRAFDINTVVSFSYDWVIDGMAFGDVRAFDLYTNNDNTTIDFNINIGATGSVTSRSSYTIYAGSDGLNTTGDINVNNAGTIQGSNAAAVFLFGMPEITVSNTGTITTNATDSSWSNAVFLTAVKNGSVFNSGLIETKAITTSVAGYVVNDHAAVSVNSSNISADFTVTNTGTIRGGSHSVYMAANASHLINSGLLDGNVYFDNASGSGEIVNSGTISGDIQLDNATDLVVNSGTITGDILMKGGDDVFDGRGGTLFGAVHGEFGDDTYYVDSESTHLVELSFQGTDHVLSEVNYKLDANFENLTLLGDAKRGIGNTENNVINGNLNDNILRGKAGNDTMNGGEGDDSLRGGKGVDTLNGEAGDDVLNGHQGNDILSGGSGDDLLRGGAGNDTYLFEFGTDDNDVISEQIGDGADTLDITGRVMSQLDFRRSGEKLVIESGGTTDSVIIDGFYQSGGKARVETLVTTTSTKILRIKDTGAATDDIIVGHSGDQVIKGLAGDDILIGKGGKDRITGGAGADRFDYDDLTDSGTIATTMDTIYDFVSGTDKIDLFDIDADETTDGNQNFSFIGAAAYSGTAGELRYQTIGGNTRIGVDVDGDMVDDFNILIAGNIAFGAGDFVL